MAGSSRPSSAITCLILLLLESTAAKKYCWYVDAGYPTYFMFLLMMGVLFCCGAGFFIRRRLHPPQMTDDPPFTVGFTRQPVNTTGCQTTGNTQSGMQYYTEPGAPVVNPMASTFQIQPNFPLLNPAYPPPPAYCNQPPPPYEQVVKTTNKQSER
ncbi:WW domain binding protein VOPP1 isoform X2 [Mobula birostris]|uniref:WW domain binding protein VOPP1 isoform X2 n=1 Tax=Mobula birostris TaxID=1983395 RepID=UPI003B287CFB